MMELTDIEFAAKRRQVVHMATNIIMWCDQYGEDTVADHEWEKLWAYMNGNEKLIALAESIGVRF